MDDGQDPREMREMVTIMRPNGKEFVVALHSAQIRHHHMKAGRGGLAERIERWEKAIAKAEQEKAEKATIKTPIGDEIEVGLEIARKRVNDWKENSKCLVEQVDTWDAAIKVAQEA